VPNTRSTASMPCSFASATAPVKVLPGPFNAINAAALEEARHRLLRHRRDGAGSKPRGGRVQ
ncbi:hypothetical protein, partial [Streptomyces sp. NPDC002215]|uniref:hypothetical protein n=1 Tax=Streptomyces sp. NPDC002215 TaxID=3154412 RepID=UPI003323B9BF